MTNLPAFWAVVPAAGSGRRLAAGEGQADPRPKQYRDLLGKAVLAHSVERLLALSRIGQVLVAVAPGDALWSELAISRDARVGTVTGGGERHESVLRALEALAGRADDRDWVLVHDAVRPCVRKTCIEGLIDELAGHPVGGLLGFPVSDTLKQIDAAGDVEHTIDRSRIWAAATPQMFRYGLLRRALERHLEQSLGPTDEAMAVEALGLKPRLVEGRRDNMKITVAGDLELAALILQAQEREAN